MGVQIFINLDNQSGKFRPGQTIAGNITLNTSSNVTVAGLTLSFVGEGVVRWTEMESRRDPVSPHINSHHNLGHHHNHHHERHNTHHHRHHHHEHHHHHHEHHDHSDASSDFQRIHHVAREYLNQETYLNFFMPLPIGDGVGTLSGSGIELPAGYYQVIPFTYQLPLGIPSSCNLAHGSVKYFAEASLKIKHSLLVFTTQSNKTFKREFEILGSLELPLVNHALNPFNLRIQKEFKSGLCCCTSVDGEFEMNLQLARTGFTPGEAVIFQLHFANSSSNTIKIIKAHLIQTITYITFGKEKVESNELGVAVYNTPIIPGLNGTWSGELRLPQTAYLTDFGGCRIITVRYNLLINAKASVFKKAVLEAPITVGTMTY